MVVRKRTDVAGEVRSPFDDSPIDRRFARPHDRRRLQYVTLCVARALGRRNSISNTQVEQVEQVRRQERTKVSYTQNDKDVERVACEQVGNVVGLLDVPHALGSQYRCQKANLNQPLELPGFKYDSLMNLALAERRSFT